MHLTMFVTQRWRKHDTKRPSGLVSGWKPDYAFNGSLGEERRGAAATPVRVKGMRDCSCKTSPLTLRTAYCCWPLAFFPSLSSFSVLSLKLLMTNVVANHGCWDVRMRECKHVPVNDGKIQYTCREQSGIWPSLHPSPNLARDGHLLLNVRLNPPIKEW